MGNSHIDIFATLRGYHSIGTRDEMLSLTDMWRAAGAEERNRPAQWQRTDIGESFIGFISGNLKLKDSQVWNVIRGKHGGTWAHWHVAMAYAKHLSPAFHVASVVLLKSEDQIFSV